jgi:hypothetical protein
VAETEAGGVDAVDLGADDVGMAERVFDGALTCTVPLALYVPCPVGVT